MTPKTKNICLILGFGLGFILAYNLAISKTIKFKSDYKTLNQEAIASENIPSQLAILKRKDMYYDSLLTSYKINGSSINNSLLKTINGYVNRNTIKLISFEEPHSVKENNLVAKTYQFTLEGDYNSILELVYHLEQKTKFGEIINLHFEKKKNYRTRKSYLQAKVLLKSFG